MRWGGNSARTVGFFSTEKRSDLVWTVETIGEPSINERGAGIYSQIHSVILFKSEAALSISSPAEDCSLQLM